MKQSIFLSALLVTSMPSFGELSRQALEQKVLQTEFRVKRLESTTSAQVVLELLERVEQLQAENAELLGRLEEQGNEIDRLKKRQRDLYLDIDRRLTQVNVSTAATAEPAALPSAGYTPPPADASSEVSDIPTVKPIDPAQERRDYEAAFGLLREGRHNDAIVAFKQHITNYVGGSYAHNAQYWIGEAYYVTRQFEDAVAAFNVVIEKYPNSNKEPDARLKLGYTYYELKQWDKARKTLAEIVQRYPTSKAASLAEKRLLIMTQEQR